MNILISCEESQAFATAFRSKGHNSCNDCLYYDVCTSYELCLPDNVNCKYFKDRNRFVELPCKYFQKCFVIPTTENKLPYITEMQCIGFSLSNGSYNANLITDKNKLYQPCFSSFGKTVFLTREEAERKFNDDIISVHLPLDVNSDEVGVYYLL